ncbi:hypothetical protein [Heliophilum fasciatum]|uniref:Uncharacterized protein n=1 Tax=Heliophilum fasciatum TaxID=35700 RepID=A0A4R2RFJ8_9FIRM|nr:hypothetical protein [Heliophilum fasciatum]MCW2279114.1 hypothetical protein [Heliophilum fasciatum]TCP61258.1 hypothetical protein EDD73_12911 [Heliophilum fasciatum]
MTIHAFTGGASIIDQATMNNLISLQPFSIIFEGTQIDGVIGAGIVEFDCASVDRAFRFAANGMTEIARVELEMVRSGAGADLVVEIRSGLMANGATDGTLVKSTYVPKEFLPTTKGFVSIPFDATGLTAGAVYWLVVRRLGDATNHFHVIGETTTNVNYPCYSRAESSGPWATTNTAHFRIMSGDTGAIKHGYYGGAFSTVEYDAAGLMQKIYRYVPALGANLGGIRDVLTLTYAANIIKRGVIA